MRGVLLLGIIATLMSLTGCGQSSSYDPWAGDRKTANPPPRPPICPQLAELANVTRDDGAIIDVRIIQIDDVKLYVPKVWMGRFNDEADAKYRSRNPTTDGPFGLYDPDLSDNECPGVVHQWVSKRDMFDLAFNFVVRRSNAEPWIRPNFTLETKVDKLSISRPQGLVNPKAATPSMFEEKIIDDLPRLASAYIVLVPKHLVGVYPWSKEKPVGSPEWVKARSDVIGLVQWVRTPPNKRDNDRIFNLDLR